MVFGTNLRKCFTRGVSRSVQPGLLSNGLECPIMHLFHRESSPDAKNIWFPSILLATFQSRGPQRVSAHIAPEAVLPLPVRTVPEPWSETLMQIKFFLKIIF